jgi:hypothetical protein
MAIDCHQSGPILNLSIAYDVSGFISCPVSLADVSWKGRTFLMFGEDIQERGELMPNQDAAFRRAGSGGQHD